MDEGVFALLFVVIFIIFIIVCCCCCCCGGTQASQHSRNEGTFATQASHESYRGYSVSQGFKEKHVANAREIPVGTNAKESYAERKANWYSIDPSSTYTIISVYDTAKFYREIEAEASRKASGENYFTTSGRYHVLNFTVRNGCYDYDREGNASLVLSCNSYREINHLHYVKF